MPVANTIRIACASACAIASTGCVDRAITELDVDPSGPEGGDDGDDGDDVVVDEGVPPPPANCPEAELASQVPLDVAIDLAVAVDEFTTSCSEPGSPETELVWTAPFDGVFAMQTVGSTFDPVLAVLDGHCTGPEIACNDDGFDLESSLQVSAYAGQTLTILVGSFRDEVGATTLRISSVGGGDCPDADLGDVIPVLVADDSTAAPDRTGSSCGGVGGPDRLYGFTAAQAGLYAFGALDAGFDSVLYLQEETCSFIELACNDDLPGTLASGLGHRLDAGQAVTVGVDAIGSGGPFTLGIDRIATEACPFEFLGSGWPLQVQGDTLTGVNSAGSSCDGWFATDHTYAWVAPETATWRLRIVDADYFAVLSVFDDDCDGQELGCATTFDGVRGTSSILVSTEAGQPLAIALDGALGQSGSYTFSIDRYEGCEAVELPSDLFVSIEGSTVGRFSDNAGSCAPTDQAPEAVFRYVPPATLAYVIDTHGSSFDTVLYARAPDCLGMENACSDDTGRELTSELVLDLEEGEPIYLFVDGYAGDAGPYRLQIAAL